MCGEKPTPCRNCVGWMGSPPRVRGKGCSAVSCSAPYRITPACAGKSRSWTKTKSSGGDHPRVCGEKPLYISRYMACAGSPPRVRGKVSTAFWNPSSVGITPACAGKRKSCPRLKAACRDHPRVCGEKFLAGGCLVGWLGSPPRVRGKAAGGAGGNHPAGITPACAGKSRGDVLSSLRA